MDVVGAGRALRRSSRSSLDGVRQEERRAVVQVVESTRVMSTPPIVISPKAEIERAARLLAEKSIGCLPVIEEGKLVGLLTETDVLRCIAGSWYERF